MVGESAREQTLIMGDPQGRPYYTRCYFYNSIGDNIMSKDHYDLSTAKQILDAKNTSNKYYLFTDKLIICNQDNQIIKIIYPPSDAKTFAKHMLVKFSHIYYELDYLAIIVTTRLDDWWFKINEDRLELSKEYHFCK